MLKSITNVQLLEVKYGYCIVYTFSNQMADRATDTFTSYSVTVHHRVHQDAGF
jgi:hypothetical protein